MGDADQMSEAPPSSFSLDPVAYLVAELSAAVGLVALVPLVGWDRATPCDGWDVRDVVNHLSTVTEKFTRFACGEDGLLREERRDWLGEEPAAGFAAIAAASQRAWIEHPEALDRTCQLPFGEFDGAVAAAINLFDVVVHGWDVATAVGLTWRPALGAVDLSIGVAEQLVAPESRASGQFAPPSSSSSPTPLGRLLAMTGRRSGG